MSTARKSRATVGDAIFSVAYFVSRMGRYLTLWPGDVVWLGTDGPTENLQNGDVAEIHCPEIGTLRNQIVRAHAETRNETARAE